MVAAGGLAARGIAAGRADGAAEGRSGGAAGLDGALEGAQADVRAAGTPCAACAAGAGRLEGACGAAAACWPATGAAWAQVEVERRSAGEAEGEGEGDGEGEGRELVGSSVSRVLRRGAAVRSADSAGRGTPGACARACSGRAAASGASPGIAVDLAGGDAGRT